MRFGERSCLFNFGNFSKNFTLKVNSSILFYDFSRLVLNNSFLLIICLRNIWLLNLLKYLQLYSIWTDVSRQLNSQFGSQSFITVHKDAFSPIPMTMVYYQIFPRHYRGSNVDYNILLFNNYYTLYCYVMYRNDVIKYKEFGILLCIR